MKNIKLKVNTTNSKYKIIIGSGIVGQLSEILNENSIEFNLMENDTLKYEKISRLTLARKFFSKLLRNLIR